MKSKKPAEKQPIPVLVVAGEISGDNLGGWILSEIKTLGNYSFFGTGGSAMEKVGVEIIFNLEELAIVGITEVIFKYPELLKKMKTLVEQCVKRNAKHAILIDFPGFNLKLAQKLSAEGIACYQISSPQIWGWRYGRIEKIRRYIKSVLCFYPFEKDIYDRENIEAFYMGHPIVKTLQKIKTRTPKGKRTQKIIALLPGSRKMEIKNLLPYMLELAEKFHTDHPEYTFEIPAASKQIAELIKTYPLPDFISLKDKSAAEILSRSHAAVACSGTVTLECSYFKVPFFLVYKASWLTYHIAKRLAQVKHLGMPNIIMGREVTREFWQQQVNVKTTLPELKRIVLDNKARVAIKQDLAEVAQKLGDGKAAAKAARFIFKKLT